jgi:hypothetical protein
VGVELRGSFSLIAGRKFVTGIWRHMWDGSEDFQKLFARTPRGSCGNEIPFFESGHLLGNGRGDVLFGRNSLRLRGLLKATEQRFGEMDGHRVHRFVTSLVLPRDAATTITSLFKSAFICVYLRFDFQ